ncbi:hypothetical protein B0A54_03813 [Friedmanniomyces endolithicus]|uniref:Cysteine protease n=1 Tax=Friedmanniomyces endolithicus TaxID=329885 RepID=A0A4U0VCX5_9PEZI|nr:hypothetical protein B0A54_03813 [Friedmanniomyces endolithicus]
MSNTDFSRFTKHVVQYFWDPPARNEDAADIWCLGRRYDSRYLDARQSKVISTSPSAQSDPDASPADSAVVTVDPQKPEETAENGRDDLANSRATLSVSEEEALGWPADFLDDMEARIWLSYRSGFPPIARSNDPSVSSAMSFSTKLRNLGAQGGFTSDTGWGSLLHLGRDWRVGQREQEHMELLSLFADTPDAPFSIHNFVEHGAQACGKHPGEWFGPSATARSLQALTDKYPLANLRVYARPDDSDVYAESLLALASQKHPDDAFEPTLIVLGVRLGIDRITPVYHAALKAALAMPQSVGIAGGRPSSSHYFTGYQGEQFFYLDPHTTRPALLPTSSSAEAEAGQQQKGLSGEDVRTCHTRRVRRLKITEMDPSMLLGFLVRSREDFEEWRRGIEGVVGKAIVHVHEREPRYATGIERAGAVDEVETWDEGTEGEDGEVEEDGGGDQS